MKWIFRIVFTLLTLAVVAVAALFLIPTDRIARLAESQFETQTGRALTLSDDVSPQIFPRLGVVLKDIEIANAEWSDKGPMVKAEELSLGLNLSSLFSGEFVVEAARLTNPQVLLERASDGHENWQFITELGGESDSSTDAAAPSISVPLAELIGGTLTFVDETAGQTYELTSIDAAFRAPDFNGPGTLDLAAAYNDQPFELQLSTDRVQDLIDGVVTQASVNLSVGKSLVDISGKFGTSPFQVEGKLDADIADPNAVFALIGSVPPRIPAGMGQRTRATADLTLVNDEDLFLRNAVIQLDQNILRGDVDVVLGEKPLVTAKLTADALDFSAMSTDTSSGDGAANTESGGWSDARLDVSGLSAVDGTFSLDASAVDLGSVKLGPTAISGTIDNSRMVLDLRKVTIFDGTAVGSFVVNARGGLSVRGDIAASDVAMQQVLNDFAGYDRLSARADMQLSFLGVGGNMAELMRSLDGSGRFNVGGGEIRGLDIVGMIRNLDASFEGEGARTIFDSITGSFTLASGVLRNDDLIFAAPLVNATGKGQVDIGSQTIEYRVDPTALAEQFGRGVRVPILISGPWNNIKFRPDLAALVDTAVEAEVDKIEDRAQEAIDAKTEELKDDVADQLGVDRENGQSVEDAVKDQIEQKAVDALKKLFD